jgi:hypothetical protein
MTAPAAASGHRARFRLRAYAWLIDAIPYIVVPYVVGGVTGSAVAGLAAFLITGVVWSILPEARGGMTVGKLLLGIRVVDARGDGGPPLGFARASLRWFVKYIVCGVLPVGYLWYYRDGACRTWADAAARTDVIDVVSPG